MKYFIDTEFNEFGGQLLSLALVREDGESLYITYNVYETLGPWVSVNVMPHILSVPSPFPGKCWQKMSQEMGAKAISNFLRGDPNPIIIADWPDDIKYFCQAIMTGPGMMVGIRDIKFHMLRGVIAWPNNIPNAVQHNAYWDALALKEAIMGEKNV